MPRVPEELFVRPGSLERRGALWSGNIDGGHAFDSSGWWGELADSHLAQSAAQLHEIGIDLRVAEAIMAAVGVVDRLGPIESLLANRVFSPSANDQNSAVQALLARFTEHGPADEGSLLEGYEAQSVSAEWVERTLSAKSRESFDLESWYDSLDD